MVIASLTQVFGQRAFPPDLLPRAEVYSPLLCFEGKGLFFWRLQGPLRRRGEAVQNALRRGVGGGDGHCAQLRHVLPRGACSWLLPLACLCPPTPTPRVLITSRSITKSCPWYEKIFPTEATAPSAKDCRPAPHLAGQPWPLSNRVEAAPVPASNSGWSLAVSGII